MTERRRSTVFDYSNLRLHPDGSRVSQSARNHKPALSRTNARSVRNHWIAKDAGGPGTVPKFRRKQGKGKSTSNEEDLGEEFEDVPNSDEAVENQKKRKSKRVDLRPLKKQKFRTDEDYITTLPNQLIGECPTADELNLPEPSADLLKCIHRFAAEFYTERGQLLNITRQWRKEKKERKRLRMEQTSKDGGSHSASSGSGSEEDKLESDKGEVSQPRRKRNEKVYIDMYKKLDGSAIMALGMLVQEYIAGLLRTSPPEQWKSLTKRNANGPGENKLVTQSDEDETEDQGDDSVIENDQQSLRSEDTQNSDSEAEYR